MAGIIIREKFGESIAAKVKVAWNELASLEKQIEEKEKNNEECDDLYDKAFEIEDALSNETGIWMQTDVVMVAGEPILRDEEIDLKSKVAALLPKRTYKKDNDTIDFKLDASFKKTGISFVALDLETATFDRNSICEVGITIVENSQIKESHSWLVQPPYNEYDSFNVDIHGITPDMTADKPDFTEVWKEVEPYLTGKVVVAHNTGFDMYVLRDTFLTDNISFPSFPFFCSYRLSTKLIKNCYSYSLPYVCETVGIQMTSHHRATVDTEACACLFLKCLEISECDSFDELQDKYYFKCGRFSPHYFRPQLSNSTSSLSFKLSEINRDPSKIDEGSYFYGKAVCFTGACKYGTRVELLQKIADIGGIPVNSVTKKTDILVVGQQDYRRVGEDGMSSKQEKAIALKDAGIDIEIMSETEFLKAI